MVQKVLEYLTQRAHSHLKTIKSLNQNQNQVKVSLSLGPARQLSYIQKAIRANPKSNRLKVTTITTGMPEFNIFFIDLYLKHTYLLGPTNFILNEAIAYFIIHVRHS